MICKSFELMKIEQEFWLTLICRSSFVLTQGKSINILGWRGDLRERRSVVHIM